MNKMVECSLGMVVLAAVVICIASVGATEGDGQTPSGFITRFDQDGDGLVSYEEFPGKDEIFSRMDRNADGVVDAREAPGREGRVSRMIEQHDEDGDGQLSSSEFPGPDTFFAHLDTDGNGLLSAEELIAGRPGPPSGKRFEQDDADKDGKVSQEEFSGPESLFARLDQDGDGFITQEEAEAGRPCRP